MILKEENIDVQQWAVEDISERRENFFGDGSVLYVDWDGPDDPQNPKK